MIILSKKRIMMLIGTVMIAMFTFILQTASVNKTMQTVALPVSDKVIVLDAGHGKPDEGAQSSTRHNRGPDKFKNSIKSSKSS